MIEVDLQDQRYRRYLIHIFVVLVFLAYLASANYIFSHLLTVDGEAEVHNINIPEETGNIRYYIDPIQIRQIEWKGIIAINGWAFIEGVDAYNYSTYILLKADTKEYVFDTSMEMRPDITQHFASLQLDLDKSGFHSNIPLERIQDEMYQIGIKISRNDADSISYTLTNTYIIKKGRYIEMEKR